MELQVGTILVAKNPCVMTHGNSENKNALIVGKEYCVLSKDSYEISVKSEVAEMHRFELSDKNKNTSYKTYFDIKN